VILTETPLRGAFLIDLELHADERGFFARTYCQREFEARGIAFDIVQANLSFSHRAGTTRGMHFQSNSFSEAKLIRCVQGAIHDVIIDLRTESLSYKKHFAVELSAGNRRALFVPQSFAHGFQSLEDNTVVEYQMGAFHVPQAASGYRYDDPAFAIDWPLPVSCISAQDLAWRAFRP
jgi:dTDP-4-dehydrorhamnose 3,5-epimerase